MSEHNKSDDKDLPLRDDIRLLGRILGDTVRAQEGEAVFDLVEAIRQWEPRCELVKVTPSIEEAQITLRVQWKLADGVKRETEVRL